MTVSNSRPFVLRLVMISIAFGHNVCLRAVSAAPDKETTD
jgi:hypothetical protein